MGKHSGTAARRPDERWTGPRRVASALLLVAAALGGLSACPGGGGSDPDIGGGDTARDSAGAPDTVAADADGGARDSVAPVDTSAQEDGAAPRDSGAPPDADPASFPMSCQIHPDCATPCGNGRCVDRRCTFPGPQERCVVVDEATQMGSCVDAGALDPSSPCLLCNPLVQGEAYTSVVFANDFEGGSSGMTITKLTSTTATWRVTSRRAVQGSGCLYFGRPDEASYGVGVRTAGTATTPPLRPPAGAPLRLSFELWLDTEETAGFDYLRILVDQGAGAQPVEVWRSDALGGTTYGEWLPVSVDLSAVAAPEMRLVFEFDTVDGIINDFEGAYLDLLSVTTGCCAVDAHCVDADPCTRDRCEAGACVFDPIEGCCLLDRDCDDGDLCTEDRCAGAGESCSSSPIPGCCHDRADCDDGDPCTEDRCPGDGERCTHQPLCCEGDPDCDDGDPCTEGRCDDGQCRYVLACCEADVDCDDGDPCTDDLCGGDALCFYSFNYLPGCCRPDILTERFDEGLPVGWILSPPVSGVGWGVLSTERAPSGGHALYYGHPTLEYYDTGSANSGVATSAPLRLPSDVEIRLSVSVLLDVEPGLFKDIFRLDAQVGSATVELVSKGDLVTGQWQTVNVDISYLAGQSVRLRFSFDTVDGLANGTAGVMIDDLRILSSCRARSCSSDAGCTSAAPCISGSCSPAGGCAYGGGC